MGAATIGTFRRVYHGLWVRAIPGIVIFSTFSTARTHATKIGLMPELLAAVALLDGSPTTIVLDVHPEMQ